MADDSDVFSFDIDPTDPQHVLVSACSGVYRSANGGEQWSRFTMIPDPSRRVYFVRIYPGGLWRSLDAGATWQKILPAKVRSIAFHPSEGRTIYLAAEDAGLLVSYDLGITARPIGAGFVSRNVWSIQGAATSFLTTDGQFLEMSRSSAKWIGLESPSGEPRRFSGILEVTSGELIIDTGTALYRSSRPGFPWTKLPSVSSSSRLRVLKAVASKGPVVLASASDGLYLSEDLGDTWTGVLGGPIEALFAGAASGGRVVARSAERLLLSTDGARTWISITHPFRAGELYDLDLDSEGVILAATARGLFRSTDSGRSWSRRDGPLGTSTVKCVRFHPRRGVALALQGTEIHISMDSGVSWTRVESRNLDAERPQSIEVSARAPERIFVLTRVRGIFVSSLSEIVARPKAADRK